MSSDEVDLVRLDENVKHIRKSVDRLLEEQGELKSRVQSNESDIKNIDDDVKDLDEDVGQLNNRVVYGAIFTILTILVTAGFSTWLGL